MSPLSRSLRLLPNLIAAVILLQTLFFKFTAAPESVYIFSTLGLEPIGRIGSGVAELIAALLLLWPASAWVGAALALGINTVAAPLLVMQPAMGAGFAASRTPTPLKNCLRSLANHTVFGFGLYLSALAIGLVSR